MYVFNKIEATSILMPYPYVLDFWKIKLEMGPFKYYVSREVHFARFFSGGFTTMAVMNPPERKLAKRTSVRWVGQKMAIFADLQYYLCWCRWVGWWALKSNKHADVILCWSQIQINWLKRSKLLRSKLPIHLYLIFEKPCW